MKTIMVVDDEEDTRLSVKSVLEDEGFAVIMAKDGQDCLNKLDEAKPVLILLDIMMPGLTSIQIIKAIRKNKETAKIKIIFLTVVRFADITQKDLMVENVVDFIEKPFNNYNLIERIKKVIKDTALKDIIKENNSVLFIFSDKNYNELLINKVKEIVNNDKVCYATLNKGRDAIVASLKKNKIKSDNFFFVDSITETVVDIKNTKDCIYVSSPNALEEIDSAIDKAVEKQNPKFIIFDSLNSLKIYHKNNMILNFIKDLIDKTKEINLHLILIACQDKESDLCKKLLMFVNKVVDL